MNMKKWVGRSVGFFLMIFTSVSGADNRFQLLGVSKTHLAVREITSGVDCCGSETPVTCNYPGILEQARKLPPILDSEGKKKVVLIPKGLKLHFLSYEIKRWTPLLSTDNAESEQLKTFNIYPVAIDPAKCANQKTANQELHRAKAFAEKVGIDLTQENAFTTTIITPQSAPFAKCGPRKPVLGCQMRAYQVTYHRNPLDESEPIDDDQGYDIRWQLFPVARDMILTYYSSTAQFYALPVVTHHFVKLKLDVTQLSVMSFGIAGHWEQPRFVVRQAE